MDYGLGMYDDVDVFGGDVKEPAGLYELEAFVHHGCRVDGDLGAHIPVGVLEGVCGRSSGYAGALPCAERAPGGGEVNPFHLVALGAEKALEDGRMLGIHRQDDGAVLPHCTHDDTACSNEGLFVCECDDFAGLEGGKRGTKPAEADHGTHDYVYVAAAHERAEAVCAEPDLGVCVFKLFAEAFVA